MYTPTSFKEERLEVLHRLMRSNPLGLLVSNGENGPLATASPTWNYAMVQARGLAQVIDDATWLKRQITSLTNQQEATAVNPWKVSDAPGDYIDAQLKGIIGLEIKITALEGKWKVSQNRSLKDRSGVAENLSAQGKDEMAQLVRDYGGLDSANS